MAIAPVRMEYKIQLANVDRGRDVAETVVVGRHPSETAEHLTLRVLAWCLLNEDRLEIGPGLSAADAADLWTHDLTGRLTTWIECGSAQGEELRRVLQQNAGAKAHVVLYEPRRRDDLLAEIARWKRSLPLTVWFVDPELVRALAGIEDRRQRWQVTITDDHIYVEVDGAAFDGEARRETESR